MQSLAVLLILVGSVFAKGYFGLFPFKSGRIVGGNATPIDYHPYTASVQIDGAHLCGGTIINHRSILTSPQCTLNIPNENISIRVGSTTSQGGGQLFQVEHVYNHPNFHPDFFFDNDVAVVHVIGNFVFGPGVQPIAMPPQGAGTPAGAMATITGWGQLEEGGTFSPVLQYSNIPIITNAQCNTLYGAFGSPVTDAMICAGFPEGGVGPCFGDYAAPLTFGNQIVGFFSWSSGCGRPALPSVYTRVSYYRNWIDEHS